jgi:serine/threonine-protein kinase
MEERKLCVVCAKVYRADISVCPDDGSPLVFEAGATTGASRLGHVLGHYRLQRVIGEGGVGTVYEGEHVQLGRKMALKVLHPDGATGEVIRRFFNEARAVNEIRHPNILEVEDFVTTDDGEHYLLMELLVGEDLRAKLSRDGVLPPEQVTQIGDQLASALSAVHGVGIVHRDLKPDNIYVCDNGECKLLDFGIAKFMTEGQGVTRAGMTLGTPEYMAPEQIVARGAPGPRTDIYALGMVMYECLAGAPAFTATTTAGVLRGHISEQVVPPSQRRGQPVPAVLEAAILKCLEKDPEKRFADSFELREALRADKPVQRAVAILAPPKRRRRRALHMLPAFAMAIAALVIHLAPLETAASSPAPRAAAAPPRPAPAAPAPPPPAPPPPPPSPPPAPSPPAEVKLALASDPAGAELFLGAERTPIGRAPVTRKIAMSTDPLQIVARFRDGREVTQSVVPDRALPPLRFVEQRDATKPHAAPTKPSKAPAPTEANAPEHDGTIDPFK